MRWLIGILIIVLILSGALWHYRDRLEMMLFRPTRGDVAYGQVSAAQKLDFYAADHGKSARSLVIYIHGGAFRFGDKSEPYLWFVKAVKRLNAAGLSVASINYRLADEQTFPAAVSDARSAVRWLRAHSAQFNIDPDRIAVWGTSAGANLALMVGVTADQPMFNDPAIASGASSAVTAVVALYGHTDLLSMDRQLRDNGCSADLVTHDDPTSAESVYFGAPMPSVPDKVRAASPISYVRANLPPMLFQTGTGDCIVPHQQSETMHRALQAAGSPSRLMLFEGADHAAAVFDTADNQELIVQFLQDHLNGPAIP